MYVREKIGAVEKNLQMGKTPATVDKLKLISARGIESTVTNGDGLFLTGQLHKEKCQVQTVLEF
jgi:hypothetical protein